MKPQTVLFYLTLITVLLAVSVSGWRRRKGAKVQPKTFSCVGTYKLDTDPSDKKFGKYLAAIGVKPETAMIIQSGKKVLIAIHPPNATHFNTEHITRESSIKHIFESGKEFESILPDGTKVQSTVTVDKKKKTSKRVFKMNGINGKEDVHFSATGLTIKMVARKVGASLKFSKLKEGPIDDQPYDEWLETFKQEFFKD